MRTGAIEDADGDLDEREAGEDTAPSARSALSQTSCHSLLAPPAGLRAWVAPLILFLKSRFCAGERRFQTEYAARANGMRRRSFIVLLESPSKDECRARPANGPLVRVILPRERPGGNVKSSTARRVPTQAERWLGLAWEPIGGGRVRRRVVGC